MVQWYKNLTNIDDLVGIVYILIKPLV